MVYIDIHGYMSGPGHIWHPHLRKMIIQSGNTIIAPQLPGKAEPHYVEWLEIIHDCVTTHQGKPITLIGHSLGTRAVLLYLDEYDVSVDQIVLIAPFDNNPENASFRDGAYANFFRERVNIDTLKQKVKTIKVIGSEDDSRIPYTQAETIAEELGATLDTIPRSDHFLLAAWAEPLWEIISR